MATCPNCNTTISFDLWNLYINEGVNRGDLQTNPDRLVMKFGFFCECSSMPTGIKFGVPLTHVPNEWMPLVEMMSGKL